MKRRRSETQAAETIVSLYENDPNYEKERKLSIYARCRHGHAAALRWEKAHENRQERIKDMKRAIEIFNVAIGRLERGETI